MGAPVAALDANPAVRIYVVAVWLGAERNVTENVTDENAGTWVQVIGLY